LAETLYSWFTLHFIDNMIRETRAHVNYNYIFFDCINRAFRMLSDVFVLIGFLKITFYLDYGSEYRRLLEPSAVILLFFGFFHISMLFAMSFTWLGFVDIGA
jgi:hypothetical protein